MWREGVYPQRFGNATDEGRINQEQRVSVGYPAGVRKPCRQRKYAYFHQHTLADDMGRYHFDKADLEVVCEAGVDHSVLQRQTTQPRPLVSSSGSVLDRRRPPEQSPPGPLEIRSTLVRAVIIQSTNQDAGHRPCGHQSRWRRFRRIRTRFAQTGPWSCLTYPSVENLAGMKEPR